MPNTNPTILRLSSVDEQLLTSLVKRTSAQSKADVVRFSLELMREMWRYHSMGASFSVHDDEGDLYSIHLGKVIGEGDSGAREPKKKLNYTIQFRLKDDHQAILDWLIEKDAAISRSAAVRSAVIFYEEIISEIKQGNSIVVVFSTNQKMPLDIPGTMSTSLQIAATTKKPKKRVKANRLSCPNWPEPGEELSLDKIKSYHRQGEWHSILIGIKKIQDEKDFYEILKFHIGNGTELFYAHSNINILEPAIKRLHDEDPYLYQKSRQLLYIIPLNESTFNLYEEVVIFNFLNDRNSVGFLWKADKNFGVVATPRQMETLSREFRGPANTKRVRQSVAERPVYAPIVLAA